MGLTVHGLTVHKESALAKGGWLVGTQQEEACPRALELLGPVTALLHVALSDCFSLDLDISS